MVQASAFPSLCLEIQSLYNLAAVSNGCDAAEQGTACCSIHTCRISRSAHLKMNTSKRQQRRASKVGRASSGVKHDMTRTGDHTSPCHRAFGTHCCLGFPQVRAGTHSQQTGPRREISFVAFIGTFCMCRTLSYSLLIHPTPAMVLPNNLRSRIICAHVLFTTHFGCGSVLKRDSLQMSMHSPHFGWEGQYLVVSLPHSMRRWLGDDGLSTSFPH